jgi:hypothetical protein
MMSGRSESLKQRGLLNWSAIVTNDFHTTNPDRPFNQTLSDDNPHHQNLVPVFGGRKGSGCDGRVVRSPRIWFEETSDYMTDDD